MGIYAIALDVTSGKELYRLARHDGVTKVASSDMLIQKAIDVDNLTISNGKIIPHNQLPIVRGNTCENRGILTILDRNFRDYKVCNYAGKVVDCKFEDIEELKFTNASLIEYCDFLGLLAKAFKFSNETYREAVDSLLEDGKNARDTVNNGKLEKTLQKLNMLGGNSKYIVSSNGELSINIENKSSAEIVKKFIIPKGVRIVKSFPCCETLIGCETLEGFDLKKNKINLATLGVVKNIDLSMCKLITDYKRISTVIGYNNTIEIFILPKNISILEDEDSNSLTKAKEIHIGPYVEVIGNNIFRDCNAEVIFDSLDRLKKIGRYAFFHRKKFDFDFTQCIYLESIGDSAFGDSAFDNADTYSINELDLSKCFNLTEIGKSAFNNVRFSRIKFPDQIKNIGEYAFYIDSLTDTTVEYVNIPSSISKQGLINLSLDLYHILNSFATVDIPINTYNKFKGVPEFFRLLDINKSKNDYHVTFNKREV